MTMHRVVLNFDQRDKGYIVHFLEANRRTFIGPGMRYFMFADEEGLRQFVLSCNGEDIGEFEMSLVSWERGSVYVNLTEEEYAAMR
jgi:hypothetical protein